MRRAGRLATWAAAALVAAGAAQAQSFALSGVSFSPSIYLEEAELQATVAPYLNRPIRLAGLQEMTQAVQALYTRAGILTARVALLPQTVEDGVLELTLVEATIDELTYGEGLERTNPDFLRRNLSLRAGAAPDYDQLERDLRTFEIMYDIVPQLSFGTGSEFGTVSAVVTAEVPENTRWVVSLDNYGSINTGEVRATAQAVLPNITGARDTAVLQAQVSAGQISLNGTYLRPVGRGGMAYASASASTAEIVSGSFGVLGLESESYGLTLGYRGPFAVRPVSHWLLDIYLSAQSSKSQFAALDFQETTLSEFGAEVSYQRVDQGRAWSAALGVKSGTVDTLQTSQSEGNYTIIYGSAGHARTLGENYLLDIALNFQHAPDANLASPRLFSAGGATTVRGYPVDVRSGDSGVVIRTQINRTKPIMLGQRGLNFTPFGFVDLGVVVPYRATGSEVDFDVDGMASAGFGSRVRFNDRWAGVSFVGVPLKDTAGFTGAGDPVFSIGLDYTF
jgi:hemolysin activation/secretion protein